MRVVGVDGCVDAIDSAESPRCMGAGTLSSGSSLLSSRFSYTVSSLAREGRGILWIIAWSSERDV